MHRWLRAAGFLVLWLIFESAISWLATCQPINEQGTEHGGEKYHYTLFGGPVISFTRFVLNWLFISLKQYEHELIAGFTIVLAVSTIGLWLSTRSLWRVTRSAAKAAQDAADVLPTLERAYV